MISVGYYPDIVNLDISDVAHPKLIGSLTMTPPFADNGSQSEHTVLPFWDCKLLYVSSEASASGCDTNAHLPTNTGYFIPPERPDLPKHPTGGPPESPIN